MKDVYMTDALSPSNEDHQMPLKRQRMNMMDSSILPSNSPFLSAWEWSGLSRELSALHKFHKMRVQIEEIIEDEKRNLEEHLKIDRNTIKQFEASLETLIWSPGRDPGAEAFADAEMSQIKRRLREKFTNLLTENDSSREDTFLFPMTMGNQTEAERELRTAENTLEVELASLLEDHWVSHEFNYVEPENTIMENQLFPLDKVVPANILEENVQSAEDTFPTFGETAMGNPVLVDQVPNIQEESNDDDKIERLMSLLEKSEELDLNFDDYESRDSGIWSDSVTNEGFSPPLVPIGSMQEDETVNSGNYGTLGALSGACSGITDDGDSGEEAKDANVSSPCLQSKNDEDPGGQESSQGVWVNMGDYSVLVSDPSSQSNNYEEDSEEDSDEDSEEDPDEDYEEETPCQDPLILKKKRKDLLIRVSNYYVQASDPQYFEINSPTHYTRRQGGIYSCNKCSVTRSAATKILDHIWVHHYGGMFKCPLCSKFRTTKFAVGEHIKSEHIEAFTSKRLKKKHLKFSGFSFFEK